MPDISPPGSPEPGLPVLIVVEGQHDLHFLKSISAMLHRHDPLLPDLTDLEARKQIVMLPTGGSHFTTFATRLAALGKREFHLYDREVEPETSERQVVVAAINQRPGCVALLTNKRSLENYLNPQVVTEACGLVVPIDDDSDVAGLLAQQVLAATSGPTWDQLGRRARCRLRHRIKRMLTTQAVQHMTAELLAEREPHGEVQGWLRVVQRLVEGTT